MIDSLISVFIITVMVLILLSFYIINNKYIKNQKEKFKETQCQREEIISNLNICIEEDSSCIEP